MPQMSIQKHHVDGAKEQVAGEEEATRLQAVVNGDIALDTPPAPKPEPDSAGGGIGNGSGSGNVAEPPASGGGGKKRRRTPKYRFGFAPVHEDINIGGYVMPSLPDVDQALAAKLRHENTWQEIADLISAQSPKLSSVWSTRHGTLAHAPIEAKGVIYCRGPTGSHQSRSCPRCSHNSTVSVLSQRYLAARTPTARLTRFSRGATRQGCSWGRSPRTPVDTSSPMSRQEWLRVAQEINQAPKKILEAHGQKVIRL